MYVQSAKIKENNKLRHFKSYKWYCIDGKNVYTLGDT